MDTVTISKKKYRELMAAKNRLDALSNVKKPRLHNRRGSFADLVGALKNVKEFLDNVIQTQGLQIHQTEAIEEKDISALTRTLQLDFDDTLQYFVAKKLGAQLVSFDHDFDSTDLQRIEPRALLPDDNIESA